MAALLSPSSPDRPWAAASTHVLECRRAASPTERQTHLDIRHAVFVTEQSLFDVHDLDEFDDHPDVQHVVGYVDDVPAGCVRLFPVDSVEPGERLWKGDRLAVLDEHRHTGLAGSLVRHAVASAGGCGGDRMIAWIQLSNVTIFRHLGWVTIGEPELYVDQPHQQMSIGLR